jgi:hypothetical protein
MQMNREWHEGHKMPEKATEQQRIEWHIEHAQACGCRPIPAGLMEKLSEAAPRALSRFGVDLGLGRAKGK